VRIKCPHCSIILDLPAETTKFKCAKCLAVCNITASQQSTTPEHIFAQAGNIGPILGPPGAVKQGDSMLVEQLVGYLILEIRELRRQNVDDDAVKVEMAPKLDAAVAAKADLNGDGIITEDELREVYGTKEDPIVAKLRELAQQADLNGDGVVTDEELMKFARMAEVVRAADVDGDGHISEQEMAAHYGDSEFSRKFLMLTSSEGSDSLEDALSEQELKRIVARVGPRVQIQEASQETDEEKAKKMLATHLNKQQTMANLMDADRKKKEDELQKQLRERRQRKMALKRLTNEKNLAEAGADIEKVCPVTQHLVCKHLVCMLPANFSITHKITDFRQIRNDECRQITPRIFFQFFLKLKRRLQIRNPSRDEKKHQKHSEFCNRTHWTLSV
jgi:Ca2+-binding EF-hand superfamily protein